MSEWFRWWLMIEVVALLALPLCLVAFGRLADRGYTFSKAFGLLVVAYVFWLLNTVHLVPNSRGGIIGALLLVGLFSGAVTWSRRGELRAWFEKHWIYVVAIEIAFIYVFAMAVWLRSLVGQIQNTEQPMDLMFLNAMTQADHFPPQDPWLAGENVAYYYFGYFMIAMIGQLAGVPTQIGYNIGLGMIAALTLIGAFGVVYNIIKLRESASDDDAGVLAAPPAGGSTEADALVDNEERTIRRPRRTGALVTAPEAASTAVSVADFSWRPIVFGIAGALMLVVMGNFVWLFKFASAYGIGGAGFYDWLDVDGLVADEPRHSWYPSEFFGYFGATRIYPINGEGFRAITEFPMFSFLLGDLHPHLMSLPFVLLAVGLALTLFMSDEPLDIAFWLKRPLLLTASALMLGALAFINTWDIVTFGFVLVLVALIRNWLLRPAAEPGTRRSLDSADAQLLMILGIVVFGPTVLLVATLMASLLLSLVLVAGMVTLVALFAVYLTRTAWSPVIETAVRTISFVAPLILLAACAFIPFYDGFSSQANGIFPVVTRGGVTVPGTRPVHAILYWGPLFVVVVPYLIARLIAQRDRLTARGIAWAASLPVAILVSWAVLLLLQQWFDVSKISGSGNIFEQIMDREVAWITALTFGAILSASVLALWLEVTADDAGDRQATIFALALATTAFLLVFGCEFFYVGDLFNVRMNTVFKLYYQAWLLLCMAGAFALYELAANWRFAFPRANAYRYAWATACVVAFIAAALYPLGASMNRMRPYNEAGLIKELHGLDGLSRFPADELAAIAWLKDVGEGQKIVIAEAAGNDYTEAGRISASTGVPTVLGWGGHEDQWRGTSQARAGRFEDVQALYQATDMTQVEAIVEKYGITYIYVGQLERNTYGEPALAKFEDLPVAFTSGNVTVYRAPGAGAEVEAAQ